MKRFRSVKVEFTGFLQTNFLLLSNYEEGEVHVHHFLSASFQMPSKRDFCIGREKNSIKIISKLKVIQNR